MSTSRHAYAHRERRMFEIDGIMRIQYYDIQEMEEKMQKDLKCLFRKQVDIWRLVEKL